MRRFSLLAFIAVWALGTPVHAQFMSEELSEDLIGNTAAGDGALSIEVLYEGSGGICGIETTYACGAGNTAVGYAPLGQNTTGSYNTAVGDTALHVNSTGSNNSALGYEALHSNKTGSDNTASGVNALYENTDGNYNTASGQGALHNNTSGSRNIAVGFQAGFDLTTGNNNIDIGNEGVKGESGIIRIGTSPSQTATYIAGISGESVIGTYFCVNSDGQLGTNGSGCATTSSRRYKEDIQPMAELSERLLKLRPVTFRYKAADADGNKSIQYGLIAEEVADVLPELVVFDKDGQPDAVMYQVLTPMLLNEVQKQAAEIRDLKQQQQKITAQDRRSALQDAEISQLKQQLAVMQAALVKLQSKDELVAQR